MLPYSMLPILLEINISSKVNNRCEGGMKISDHKKMTNKSDIDLYLYEHPVAILRKYFPPHKKSYLNYTRERFVFRLIDRHY